MMKDTGESADVVATNMNGKVNPAFIEYAKTTDTANMSLIGFKKYLQTTNQSLTTVAIKSKLAAVGMGLLNTVASMGISLLAGLVIGEVLSFFDDLIHRSEKIAEAAQNARQKMDELNNSFSDSKKYVDEYSERFAILSQGVNKFTGENKSLSNKEYEEFLDLSNKLAEIFPTLERNYTDNGDAILNLSGNVDTIVGSLNDLIEKEKELKNIQIADTLDEQYAGVFEKHQKYLDNLEKKQEELDAAQSEYNNYSTQQLNETISKGLDNKQIDLNMNSTVEEYNQLIDYYRNILDELGVKYSIQKDMYPDWNGETNEQGESLLSYSLGITIDPEETQENIDRAKQILDYSVQETYSYYSKKVTQLTREIALLNENNQIDWMSLNGGIDAWLNIQNEFQTLEPALQSVVQKTTDSIDWGRIDASNWEEGSEYIKDNILRVFSGISGEIDKSVSEALSSDNEGLFISAIQNIQKKINDYIKANNLDIELDVTYLTDDIYDSRERMNNKLSSMPTQDDRYELEQYLYTEGIDTSSERDYFLDLTESATTAREAISLFEEAKKKAKSGIIIDLSPIHEELDNIQSAYQTVDEAIKEYNTTKKLSLDTIQALLQLDDKYLATLYDENGQLQLNKESYQDLVEAKLMEMQVSIVSNAISAVESLSSEAAAKDYLKTVTIDLSEARWENVEAIIAETQAKLDLEKSDGKDTEERQKALDQIAESTKSKIKLIKEGLGNLNNIFDPPKTTPKTAFSEQIDWAANSISNLQNKLDRLKIKLDNTFNISDKLPIYDQIEALNKEILSASKEAAGAYKSEWTSASSNITGAYKNKIMSGEKFEIQDFDNETTYKKVTEAQKAWETYQQSLTAYVNALYTQDDLAKSKINDIIADKEIQMEILDIELENTSSAVDKNSILDERLALQKEINEELKNQAILENNDAALAALEAKEKQQIKENEQQKRDNSRAENQVYVQTYDDILQNESLSFEERKTANNRKRNFNNKDLTYDFQDIIASIGEDTWNNYLSSLKEEYKETKMSDEDFIKKHLKEISEYFIGNGMYEWYNNYQESENDYADTDYNLSLGSTEASVKENDNSIKDIQNAIDLTGKGTVKQYRDIISLQQNNIGHWETQKKLAEEIRDKNKGNLELYRLWDNRLQDCEDNIHAMENGIKEMRLAILNLPLQEVELKLQSINKEIDSQNRELEGQTELINAAIAVFDEEIETQNLIKEGIQDRIDVLQEEHDLRNANLNVQKAQYELEKAKNNKTTKVFREGVGFVFEADQEAVQEAQLNYDNAVYERKIQLLNEEIKRVDQNIESLTKQKKQWEDIIPLMERAALITKAEAYDIDFKNKVLTGNVGLLTTIRDRYGEIYEQIGTLEESKEPYELLQEELTDISQLFSLDGISYKESLERTKSAIEQYYPELLTKYEEQKTSIDEVAKKQLEGVGVTEETSEDNLEEIKTTNEEITQSYNDLLLELTDVFGQLEALMSAFSAKAMAVASYVVSSVSAISSAISATGSVVDSGINKISNALPNKYQKLDDKTLGMYNSIAKNLNTPLLPKITSLPAGVISPVTTNNNKATSVSFGDIIVNDVKNPTDFAKTIVTSLSNAMKQELYK